MPRRHRSDRFCTRLCVFAALFGWALWEEVPDRLSFAGTLLVIVAGILTIRLGGRKAAPPAELPDDAVR